MTAPVAVYPLVPTRSFDQPLSYLPPLDGSGELHVGDIVEITIGRAPRVGVIAQIDATAPAGVTLKPVIRRIDGMSIQPELVVLAEWLADTYGCARTQALSLVAPPGLASQAHAAHLATPRTVQQVRRISEADIGSASARQQALLAQLGNEWEAIARLAERLGTTRATLQKLVAGGWAEMRVAPAESASLAAVEHAPPDTGQARGSIGTPREGGVTLTAAQEAAIATILTGTPADPATLLVGVTGAGKTEVYMAVIERMLAADRGAIVLVPEIALTPQTAQRFERHFGNIVSVLHSGLGAAARKRHLARIARGDARVVVGPRSAVFAPVHNLGIIVIDEEHDSSYKQENQPRYDARRVAWKRAQLHGAMLVAGSATPRLESWHGIARHANLRERASGAHLAPVELVDLRVHGDRYPLTDPVRAALDATARRGAKSIVLLNRRGFASAVHCRACALTLRCDQCDVAYTVHGELEPRQKLSCHHCGASKPLPEMCPSCASAALTRIGAGTERLERDLREAHDVPVLRLDADVARNPGRLHEVLEEFSQPGPAILAGTQMVAKGHDFPDVDLAVVIDADAAIAVPDFRAEERAFSLVTQLAGRAGRTPESAERARVLVQAWNVESRFLAFAQTHDVDGFLADELERRRRYHYPPFTRLVRIVVSSPIEARAAEWAHHVGRGMASIEAGEVLGPARLMRIGGRHRHHIIIKTAQPARVASAMREFLRKRQRDLDRGDVRVIPDVDPQTMT